VGIALAETCDYVAHLSIFHAATAVSEHAIIQDHTTGGLALAQSNTLLASLPFCNHRLASRPYRPSALTAGIADRNHLWP